MKNSRSRMARVDPAFIDYCLRIQSHLSLSRGEHVPFTKVTRELAKFMDDEGLENVIRRRAQRNRGFLR